MSDPQTNPPTGSASKSLAAGALAAAERSGDGAAVLPTDPRVTAALLVEALPYIRRFAGKVIVIKCGGNVIEPWLASFAQDVVLIRSVGIEPIVVHGGGPQIGELMARLGKEVEFHEGHRVTDAETLDIARMVLVGKVNRDIVSAINRHGPLAVGLSGEDAKLIAAGPRSAELGYVGDVTKVDPSMLYHLLSQHLIPVVATIGTDERGQAYNINADSAAGAIAEAVGAEKLIFLTDVEGLRSGVGGRGPLIHRVSVPELEEAIEDGTAVGGMVPKLQACVRALRAGVSSAHILDGRMAHALLVELFTDAGIGTMVHP